MKQELKPCPFCGEQPMVSEKTLSVYCKNALCPETIANESDNLTDAINAWNTRPDHSGEITEMVQGETLATEIDWEQRRWDVHRDSNKIAMNVILMAQFEVSKSDPDLAKQIDWRKMIEATMDFANEVSQNVVDSYQLKQHNNEKQEG